MLIKIGISVMFFMMIAACVSGAIGLCIEMVKAFKEKDRGAGFGMLACCLLLTVIGGLVLFVWICYLLGDKPC